ncbi:unnamed protein product [Lampetra planeri]
MPRSDTLRIASHREQHQQPQGSTCKARFIAMSALLREASERLGASTHGECGSIAIFSRLRIRIRAAVFTVCATRTGHGAALRLFGRRRLVHSSKLPPPRPPLREGACPTVFVPLRGTTTVERTDAGETEPATRASRWR